MAILTTTRSLDEAIGGIKGESSLDSIALHCIALHRGYAGFCGAYVIYFEHLSNSIQP